VIDMKDEFGLNFRSENPEFRKNEGAGHGMVRDVRALLDTLHAHNVFAIARIVVFKDPTTAQVHPEWTIRRPDSSIWQDKKGTSWVDPTFVDRLHRILQFLPANVYVIAYHFLQMLLAP